MKRFSRKFIVSSQFALDFIDSVDRRSFLFANSKKVGRNRRGSVRIVAVKGCTVPGCSFVSLSFAVDQSATWKCEGGRFQRLGYTDLNKVIRSLAIAERRHKIQLVAQ
jgi:hypothetical protein